MSRIGRILIVGHLGQLGKELQRTFADAAEIVCHDRDTVDIAVPEQVREMVRAASPDLILNAAAYTAVDRAESEQDVAMAINGTAPRILAEEARKRDILLVHYSTDYVFNGAKDGPWVESDQPNPLNVYGKTKLAGEQALHETGGKHLTFRTSWVYGPHGNNFLLTMLRLGRERDTLSIVDDQVGGPTTSSQLATATRQVVDRILSGSCGAPEDWAGLYHMTCGGQVSWYGFAKQIFAWAEEMKLSARSPVLSPITTREYPTPAARPHNSVLSNEKLRSRFGVQLDDWQTALKHTLLQLVEASS